jgi:hypothetical protein
MAVEDASVAMRNRGANWRKMAEEARAIAAGMQDAAAKQTMLEIAERYEVLAACSERQAKIAKNGAKD